MTCRAHQGTNNRQRRYSGLVIGREALKSSIESTGDGGALGHMSEGGMGRRKEADGMRCTCNEVTGCVSHLPN